MAGSRRRPVPADGRARERTPSPAPRSGTSDLAPRLVAAVPLAALAIFLVAAGGEIFAAGVLVLGLVMLHELYGMYERAHPAKLAGFVGLIGMVAAAFYGDQFHVLMVLALAIPLTFFVAAAQPRGGAPSIAVTMLGLLWIGVALAHAVMLRELPNGGGIMVDVLLGTFIGDTAAYLGGRMFGRTKLAPVISPNKTLEGLLIGMLAAVLAVQAGGLYQDWLSFTDALILGVAVAVVAPVGDLFESYLKRDAGTKDAGTIFGAHGGALDRLDAATFSLVAGYFVWVALL